LPRDSFDVDNFLSNPMWTGIAGIAAILALLFLISPFLRTTKLHFGTIFGLRGSYLSTSKEVRRSTFAVFFIKNLRWTYAHNIIVYFDSSLSDCDIQRLEVFGEEPKFTVNNDADHTTLNIPLLGRRRTIIINTCSPSRPEIVKITLDNGRAFPSAVYLAKIQSQLTRNIIFMAKCLVVGLACAAIGRWLMPFLLRANS
jgi:hypothetical protein